ncbi:hypothetical protein IMZ31_20370 (plasmid) [Pontibacillus sp. ALD_SL1]|uniref:hypothetical protein n=1 Tax=Pontibacillus sp. ALD_SL1 TaxID=2777185 RepID=UPI001A96C182|nr:hypothetical protein [Pontibacillus sp. ALD_SL1]QST02906.1 hypothetical protein IMZ31_20370 [Pontibacillus sp. ALD_SL1]
MEQFLGVAGMLFAGGFLLLAPFFAGILLVHKDKKSGDFTRSVCYGTGLVLLLALISALNYGIAGVSSLAFWAAGNLINMGVSQILSKNLTIHFSHKTN